MSRNPFFFDFYFAFPGKTHPVPFTQKGYGRIELLACHLVKSLDLHLPRVILTRSVNYLLLPTLPNARYPFPPGPKS